ncbi:MAG TPA: acetylxylan esterase [Blastocatellia bacterium]|nr:acetylxylan esterase [Blastocatellia bacterium]
MTQGFTRREVLKNSATAAAGALFCLVDTKVWAQTPHEYRYGHLLQEYFVARSREMMARRAKLREAIKTPAQVMKLRDEVRQKLRACFGAFPERTPLNARITGKVERDAYTIEKLIYESRPGYQVTANLYIPKNKTGKLPAVLAPCGHTRNGKAEPKYQEYARNLARQGYVVLMFDPPAQGERFEYADKPGEPVVQWGVVSHIFAGNQMNLLGRNFALWEAWDGIRGLDYLLSRPEVDPKRVGLTGNSGGGTQTTWLNVLDDRFTMVAPNCFATRYLNNLENEEAQDTEQILPGMLAAGCDMADFYIAQLPRPTHFGGEQNDFFDVRGVRAVYDEVKRLYSIVGKGDAVEIFIGPETHGYNKGAREAMYKFFNRHAGVTASTTEPDVSPEKDEILQVTATGEIALLNSKRTYDFTREDAQQLAGKRSRLSGKTLSDELTNVLKLPARTAAPNYRIVRDRRISPTMREYGYLIETEQHNGANVFAMLHVIPKPGPQYFFPNNATATLYVPHLSAVEELVAGKAPTVAAGEPLLALDVRGIGEMTARLHKDTGDDFFLPYGTDYFYSTLAMMWNESYCGRRVHDLLSTLDLFAANGCREMHLVGRGIGAVTATFAAVLHPLVKQVTLHNALLSYHELTQDERYQWPLSTLPYGVLQRLDLPDCLRELAATKRLSVVDPWNARMQTWPREKLTEHLQSLGLEKLDVR